ncbi:unnamed protein product [Ectocarpus sp. 6 AP-2014]
MSTAPAAVTLGINIWNSPEASTHKHSTLALRAPRLSGLRLLHKDTMSQLLLVLVLSAVGFPSMESFLITSTTSAGWLDPRPASHQQRRRSSSAIFPSPRSRCSRKERPACSRATTPPPLSATTPDATEGPSQQQQRPKQSVRRKTKRRPRQHVPVDDVDSPSSEVGGEMGAGFVGDPFVDLIAPTEYAASDASGDSSRDSTPLPPSPAGGATPPLPEPTTRDRQRFERIMEEVLEEEKEEELPAILSRHVDFLLSVDVTALTNDLIRQEPTLTRVNTLRNAYEFIVSFLESMVESTVDVQKENQTLLRLIVEAAKTSPEVFDKRMKTLQDRFTFEFVKYLDGEVERLEKVEKDMAEKKRKRKVPAEKDDMPMGGDGNEVLNVIRIVRTRVCAQLDLMMGEDVAVLTRMLSYDDRFMMRAALRTVLRDKSPKEIAAFGALVSKTLGDVVALGSGVDPVLRSKLSDMSEDITAVGRDVEERQKDKREREAGGA